MSDISSKLKEKFEKMGYSPLEANSMANSKGSGIILDMIKQGETDFIEVELGQYMRELTERVKELKEEIEKLEVSKKEKEQEYADLKNNIKLEELNSKFEGIKSAKIKDGLVMFDILTDICKDKGISDDASIENGIRVLETYFSQPSALTAKPTQPSKKRKSTVQT